MKFSHSKNSYFSIKLGAPPSVVHGLFQQELKSTEIVITQSCMLLLLAAWKSSSMFTLHTELTPTLLSFIFTGTDHEQLSWCYTSKICQNIVLLLLLHF